MNTNTSESDREPGCMNLQMLRASHRVLKAYEDAYRPYGLKATQLPVLDLVAKNQDMTIKEIAEQTESERSVLSRKLQVMEKKGWIKSHVIRETREKAYSITTTGNDLLNRIQPARLTVQNQIFNHLNHKERELLLNLCDKFHSI